MRIAAVSRLVVFAAGLLAAGCAQHRPTPPASEPEPRATNAVTVNPPAAPESARAEPTPPAPHIPAGVVPESALREFFPFIRADVAGRLIEVDGVVPIDCHDPNTPDVYLELVACSPDTREHESLVMTRAKASHLHAALLAIGLTPGEPGSWRVESRKLVAVPPRGDPLEVRIAYRDAEGHEIECPIAEWVVSAETHKPFLASDPAAPSWVFAGSVIVKRQGVEVYDADGSGTVIGLTTFGSEVIAWRDTISPEAAVDAPEWIADVRKVPAAGTPVIVRIRPAK